MDSSVTYEHSGELVKHPVLWRCDALQVLLRSSCLNKRSIMAVKQRDEQPVDIKNHK